MGLLHIYCGDGKGKTTASLGLALRAAGAGMAVCFIQFMKGGDTSELNSLRLIPNISVKRCDKAYGFAENMSESEKAEIAACHNELLEYAFGGGFDVIILDEFNSAYEFGFMDKTCAEELILSGKNGAEIVLTGRNPADVFVRAADYVSEILCVNHPYYNGTAARKGIEY